MSGQLDLTFSHQGGPGVGELPVVVDVVDASLEAAVKPRLVQLASGWRQDLEPGTYLVRVRFPSGEEIRRTRTVRDGDQIPISVDVRGLAGYESLERWAALRPLVRDESTRGLAGTSFVSAWVRRWRGKASREWQSIDFDGITVGGDDHTVQYRFASDHQSNVLQLGGPDIAWRFVSLPAAPVVDVTVSPRGENDLAVEVTTDSAEAEALLGYLRTGAVAGADVTAESLLQQKRRDPIAAAIGGYYLLRTANLDRLSAWGPNLSRRFPWLADGAVINGWQHIHAGREHRGDPDRHFDAARRQLILAAQRGVPVYTEGLRLLVDGLHLVREDAEAEDAKLDAALTFIEPFALAADWSATTVTYSGADPAKPHSRRRYGIPKDHERLVPLPTDLTRANLSSAVLAGAVLANAVLAGANLRGADLTGAKLSLADLTGARLTLADLTLADLTRANLGGAYLTRANLGGANLTGADLGGTYLFGANLSDADLGGAKLSHAKLAGARLGGADLTGADLSDADLSDADLTGADLTRADLTRAYLTRADLGSAHLFGANLTRADLGGANLTEVLWSDETLWPENMASRIRDQSEELQPGVWRVIGYGRADAEIENLLPVR